MGSLWLMDRGTEGDHKGKSGSSCSGPEKERMRMWIQAEAIGWEEEERGKKKNWRWNSQDLSSEVGTEGLGGIGPHPRPQSL